MTAKHIPAARLRVNQTDAERLLLRDRRLARFKFRRQTPIGPCIVDLLCSQKGLVIELDGGQHNGSIADEKRTAWLESRHYRVLRFWNNDVLKNPDGVLTAILQALQTAPSPLEGEGGGEESTGLSGQPTSIRSPR